MMRPKRMQHPRLPGGFSPPPLGVHQVLAALVVAAALWLLALGWTGLAAAEAWLAGWRGQVEIHLYLEQDRAQAEKQLAGALSHLRGVRSLRRISPEDAANEVRAWLGDVGLSQEELARALPITFALRLDEDAASFSFDDLREIATRFGARLNRHEETLWRLHTHLSRLRHALLWAGVLVAFALAVIVANTLRMLLLARSDEIELMRLLGAAEWFVRMPFVVEGALLGAGSGLVAALLLWISEWLLQGWIGAIVIDWQALPVLVLLGVIIGMIGAAIATAGVGKQA